MECKLLPQFYWDCTKVQVTAWRPRFRLRYLLTVKL